MNLLKKEGKNDHQRKQKNNLIKKMSYMFYMFLNHINYANIIIFSMASISDFSIQKKHEETLTLFEEKQIKKEIQLMFPEARLHNGSSTLQSLKNKLSPSSSFMYSIVMLKWWPLYYYFVAVYDLRSKKSIYTNYFEMKGDSEKIRDICFSNDEKYMFIATNKKIEQFQINKNMLIMEKTWPTNIGQQQIRTCSIDPKNYFFLAIISNLKNFEQKHLTQRNLVRYNLYDPSKQQISSNKYSNCLYSQFFIEQPLSFNKSSGTFFTSGQNGHICQWNLTTLTPFYEYELPEANETLPSGAVVIINKKKITVNIVSVHEDKLFIGDEYHEISNVLEKKNNQLTMLYGIQFYIAQDYHQSLHLGEISSSQIFYFYSNAFSTVEFYLPFRHKQLVQNIILNENINFVFFDKFTNKLTVLLNGTLYPHQLTLNCQNSSLEWSYKISACVPSCEKIPFSTGKKQNCDCVSGFAYNSVTEKCEIECLEETKDKWKDNKPFCNCPKGPIKMEWDNKIRMCKNVEEEKVQKFPAWVIIFIFLFMVLVFGIVYTIMKRRKKKVGKKQTKSEKESDNNDEILTDERLSNKPFQNMNKAYSESSQKQSECEVCHKENSDVRGPCFHQYHFSCISHKIKNGQDYCPKCYNKFYQGINDIHELANCDQLTET